MREDTSIWRAEAFSAYAYLRAELERLRCLLKLSQCTGGDVAGALDEALLAMIPRQRRWLGRWHPWLALKRFYSGSDIEQTWRAIHRAQAALYVIYPPQELLPQAEHVEAVIIELPEQAVLMKSATTLISQLSAPVGSFGPKLAASMLSRLGARPESSGVTSSTDPRTMLRGIYERATDVLDHLQVQARALRNALMIASLAIFIVLLAVGVVHAIQPDIIRLCASSGQHKEVCPIGGSPRRFDVFAVELAGMLGGLLSVVIPIATGERIKTPFRIFNQQLILKTLAGAATAVGGVLLLLGHVIDTITLASRASILGYAVVFGFAQQIVTGAVDRRANSLAKETPTAKSV